jgi:hypothetical protein
MKLPADCRYATKAPTRGSIIDKIDDGEIACCRSRHSTFFSLYGHPEPLCQVTGVEVYRFHWMQAFGAHADVCIARSGTEIMLSRGYHPAVSADVERFNATLTIDEWRRLQNALIEANFWSLERSIYPVDIAILDGYELVVEGRRNNAYTATLMVNPRAAELRQLGQVAFDMAGLASIRF